MILILCVDTRYGMVFHGRRQSRDSAIIREILALSNGKRLWMNSYSQSLFPADAQLRVCADFLQQAQDGEYCFVETTDVEPYLVHAERVILFHWNRSYPADLHFPIEALERDWSVVEVSDFPGTSHDKITMEVYSR